MSYFEDLIPLKMVKKPPFTIESPNSTAAPGETRPRRHPKAKDGLLERPAPEVNTVFDLVKRSADMYPDKRAVGSRKLIQVHKELKKVPKLVDGKVQQVDKEWTFLELSEYSYLSYAEYFEQILQLGAGLRKLGLETDDRLHIFASTSAHWLAISHACASQALTIVTAYDSLGVSGVEHTLVHSAAKAIFVDPHLLPTVTTALTKAKSIQYVIYNDDSLAPVPAEQLTSFQTAHPHLTVLTLSALRALGQAHPVPPTPPAPSSTYCIMYTSGSTGPPKGVPATHAALVAAVAGVHAVAADCMSHRDAVLAYLPLAHIFELVLENLVVFLGAALGYASPRTLADAAVRRCRGDLPAFAPTVMAGVPAVWEALRKGIEARVAAAPLPARALFHSAVALKALLVRLGLPGQETLSRFAFSAIRASTGGRLRFVVNGASGLAAGTRRFVSLVVAPLTVGYGLTETCGNGILGDPLQWTAEAAGPVPGAVEVKLVEVPDLGYRVGGPRPRGELLIRGPAVVAGYFDDAGEAEAAVTADGWYRTGDVGEFSPDGHVRVVDRVKNLVKLAGGEYVALERLEAVYRGCGLVADVMVYGDSAHARPVAVVAPSEGPLREAARAVGVEGQGDVYGDPRVVAAVLKDLGEVGRRAGLSGMEILAGVVLVQEEWTPASGLVTATQKLNRRMLKEKYGKEIERCLESTQPR